MIKKSICLVLCVVLMITPALASPIGQGSFSSVTLYNLRSDGDDYTFTDSGTYVIIDSIEFLSQVVQAMQLNIAWMKNTTYIPYFVGNVEFDNSLSKRYRTIICVPHDFRITTANSGYVYINGVPYDASITNRFPTGYVTETFFDYCWQLYDNSNFYAYLMGRADGDARQVVVADTASTQTLDNILVCLDDIQTIASRIATVDSTIYTTLSNVYSALQNVEGDLQNTNSYLSQIRTNLQTVSNTCDQILSASNQTNTILTNTQTYLQTHLPLIEGDLNTINTSINNFRVDFGNFAVDCLQALNSIDSTTQHMDETLDAIMDYYNGTALENVPVTTSGGSSLNLWSLIKNSVTTTLSGIGGFFSGLFDFIGLFSSSASGFNTFLTIDSWSPVSYVPEDLTISTQNQLPDETYTNWQAGYNACWYRTGTSVRAVMSANATRNYVATIQQSFTLSPGTYLLYATGSPYVSIKLKTGSTTFGSIVTTTNYPFTINQSTTFTIEGTMDYYGKPIDHTFDLKVVRTG